MCTVQDVNNPSGVSIPVSVPSCEVPTPVADAAVYTGAIIALWVAAYAARAVINFFRGPDGYST